MKTTRMLLTIALWLLGSMLFNTCQYDDFYVSSDAEGHESDFVMTQKSLSIDNECIDPDDPVYFVMEQQAISEWGNPRRPFKKETDIEYYNTLTHFVLKVMSSSGIADILIDDESIKNFEGTILPNQWHEFYFELQENWEACDTWGFELKVTGFGPPAYFDVEYQLIGECVIVEVYTLDLVVSPEGAGTVTGAGKYMEGEEVVLTAMGNEVIYAFTEWIDQHGNIVSLDASFIYIMPGEPMMLTAYFEEVFVCGVSTITDADGNIYNTVQIGNQCWMKENLKTTQYRNDTPIDYPGTDDMAWANNTNGAYAWFENDISWKDSYGALYNWYAVKNNHDLCPAGWHVPSDSEWTDLVNYVVDQGFPDENGNPNGAGNALKSCRQVNSPIGGDCNTTEHPRWEPNDDHHGFDEFGFSAHQGRRRTSVGEYHSQGPLGNWWSSTESSTSSAWNRSLHYDRSKIYREHSFKASGFSVRCIRDIDE